jgi:CheY-like chemotaxis protein
VPNKILVVDDDPPTCELITEVLSAAEVNAFSLTDSNAAATRLRKEKFDAVFLDVRMPQPDGIELTRQIRKSGLNVRTPIVMITGEGEQQFLTRAFEVGANFVLFKPVDRQALLRLLRVTQGPIERERRRFTRVSVRCEVFITLGRERVRCMTVDLSASGMLVQGDCRFPVGSRIEFHLNLGSNNRMVRGVACVVRFVGDDFMGLEFQSLSPAGAETLQEFLVPRILQLDKSAKAC